VSSELPENGQFLSLNGVSRSQADVTLLPLPFEGTVSYGKGTAEAPAAVLRASQEIELWDEELDFSLAMLRYHTVPAFSAEPGDTPGTYVSRLYGRAQLLSESSRFLIGIGGEHTVTSPLVRGICRSKNIPLSELTIVHFDAHSDLRSDYEGEKPSHACAMRPLVDNKARLISIGVRSAEQEEFRYGQATRRVETFFAQALANEPDVESRLNSTLQNLRGNVYLTIDMDVLDVHLCPGTGTPQPGGLGWWQMLRYLRALLEQNRESTLIGCDIVETVPTAGTQVNEFVAARLLAKILAYRFCRETPTDAPREE
jgi:agmatinase